MYIWFMRIIVSCVLQVEEPTNYTYSLNGVTYILLFFLGLIALFLVLLLVFHTYVAVRNRAVWEWGPRGRIAYLRALPTGYNPFNRGPALTLNASTCRRISLNHTTCPTLTRCPCAVA